MFYYFSFVQPKRSFLPSNIRTSSHPHGGTWARMAGEGSVIWNPSSLFLLYSVLRHSKINLHRVKSPQLALQGDIVSVNFNVTWCHLNTLDPSRIWNDLGFHYFVKVIPSIALHILPAQKFTRDKACNAWLMRAHKQDGSFFSIRPSLQQRRIALWGTKGWQRAWWPLSFFKANI